MKIKHFEFPTFETFVSNESKVRLELGAYCCEIRVCCWDEKSTRCDFAVSLADTNPLNISVPTLFDRVFDGDLKKLKDWYENTINEFNTFWENHIKTNYLYEE